MHINRDNEESIRKNRATNVTAMMYTIQASLSGQSQRVSSTNTSLLNINVEDEKNKTLSSFKPEERSHSGHARSRSQPYSSRINQASSFSPERKKSKIHEIYSPSKHKNSDDYSVDSPLESRKASSNREALHPRVTPLILSKHVNNIQLTNRAAAQDSNSPSPDKIYNAGKRNSSMTYEESNKANSSKISSFTKALTNMIDPGKKLTQNIYSSNTPETRASISVQEDMKKYVTRGPAPSTITSNQNAMIHKKVITKY